MEEKANKYGHRRMIVWQNFDRIEIMIYGKILKCIPKRQFQLLDQIDRACGSCMANFVEGYYSGSTKEYIRFPRYSKRSLAELQDWVRRSHHKEFISKDVYCIFDDLAIKTLYLLNRLISSLHLKTLKPSKPSSS